MEFGKFLELANEGGKESELICQKGKEKIFLAASRSEEAIVFSKLARPYLQFLLRQMGKLVSGYSKYFLLYHFRRIRITHQFLKRAECARELEGSKNRVTQEEFGSFYREYSWFSWLYDRITLLALKYGQSDASDINVSPDKSRAGSYAFSKLEVIEAKSLWCAIFLMAEFEKTRYCLKRAGKGGKFCWKDKTKLIFDVELDSITKKLIKVFDSRVPSGGNLLSEFGSWADSPVHFHFPFPDGSFRPIDPFKMVREHNFCQTHEFSSGPNENEIFLLTLTPNIGGIDGNLGLKYQPKEEDRFLGPSWLFKWLSLEPLLPRLELINSIFKKKAELLNSPSYYPEDVIFTLAAITSWQIERSKDYFESWFPIFSFGYTVWSEVDKVLEGRVLPYFIKFKNKFSTERVFEPLKKLRAVIDDLVWQDFAKINILEFSPTKIIFPIDSDRWLIDWSLMGDFLIDFLDSQGMYGTVSQLRGVEFQKVFSAHLESQAKKLKISIWWSGPENGRLQFHGKERGRDLDIGIIVQNVLLAIELKAHAGKRELLIHGDSEKFKERWDKYIWDDFRQVDSLTECLCKERTGKNYSIPKGVKWIVPLVCNTFPEWVSSDASNLWLYDDIPRVCKPDELFDIIDRIKEGKLPNYKIGI
jgi:hypothetical protein